jgi:hypothetical protein
MTAEPQPNPTDHALPATDAKGDVDQPSDGVPVTTEAGKASEQSGFGPTESEEESGLQPENSGDETDTRVEVKAGDEDVTARDRTLGERLMVEGKPLREHLDPVGAAAWSDESVDVEPNPAGDRIADTENEKASRVEKLRKKFYETSGDARDGIRETSNSVNDLLPKHSPTGHAEVSRTPDNVSMPHDGISAGNAAVALVATGIVVGELIRWGREKVEERKGA